MCLHPIQIICSTANAVPFTPRQGRGKSQQRRCKHPCALTPSQLQSIHSRTASPTGMCPHASVTVHPLASVPLHQSNTDMPTRQCAGTPKRQSANEPTYQCADKPACRRANTAMLTRQHAQLQTCGHVNAPAREPHSEAAEPLSNTKRPDSALASLLFFLPTLDHDCFGCMKTSPGAHSAWLLHPRINRQNGCRIHPLHFACPEFPLPSNTNMPNVPMR